MQLGEVAEFVNGVAFKPTDWSDDGIPIIRIQNLTDPSKPYNRTTRVVDKRLQIDPGDLLVSWSASLGVFEWPGPETGVLNQHIFRVIPNSNLVHKPFLKHVLQSALTSIQRHLHGATMQHVNRGAFLGTQISIPTLPEQRRLAEILDKAHELCNKRRKLLNRLETLQPAIFTEMFGDPSRNPHQLKLAQISDVAEAILDGPHESPIYAPAGVPFLSTRNIRAGEIVWRDLKFVDEREAAKHWRKCRPENGDILYTKGGTTGLAAVLNANEPIAVWVHLAVLKPKRLLIEPDWLEAMLNTRYCYEQSQRLTHGIANRDLGLTRIARIRIILPPKEDQLRFASRARKVKRAIHLQRNSLERLERLSHSLQHRAFRGEL